MGLYLMPNARAHTGGRAGRANSAYIIAVTQFASATDEDAQNGAVRGCAEALYIS